MDPNFIRSTIGTCNNYEVSEHPQSTDVLCHKVSDRTIVACDHEWAIFVQDHLDVVYVTQVNFLGYVLQIIVGYYTCHLGTTGRKSVTQQSAMKVSSIGADGFRLLAELCRSDHLNTCVPTIVCLRLMLMSKLDNGHLFVSCIDIESVLDPVYS
jgi:hypothetical protein